MRTEIKPGITQGMFDFDENVGSISLRSVEITTDGKPVIGRVERLMRVKEIGRRNLARINEIGNEGSGDLLKDLEEMSRLDREAWDFLHGKNRQ